MVAKIIWAPSPRADLRSSVRHVSRDNPDAARRLGQQIIERAESRATFPEKGRVIAKFQDPDIRETILGSYRIAYRLRRSEADIVVEIARIWHGARDEENLSL